MQINATARIDTHAHSKIHIPLLFLLLSFYKCSLLTHKHAATLRFFVFLIFYLSAAAFKKDGL